MKSRTSAPPHFAVRVPAAARAAFAAAIAALALPSLVHAQVPHYLVPVTRPVPPVVAAAPVVSAVDAVVSLRDQLAVTTLTVSVRNPGSVPAEAVMLLPVPDGSVLREFSFDGLPGDGGARILPRDEARRLYNSIVARSKDPALLEFADAGAVRSSVFPVAAGATQRVRLTWEQLLTDDHGRLDYFLPRTEALDYRVPWTFAMTIESEQPVVSVYSPGHDIATATHDGRTTVSLSQAAAGQPGGIRVSVQRQTGEMSASLTAFPDAETGGGWLLLSIAPPPVRPDAVALKRELTLVLDKSGSMAGGKMDQVKAAALQLLEGLREGEAFNVIVYNEHVESFAPAPVVRDATTRQVREFLAAVQVSGGTNIHDSLTAALRQPVTPGCLPVTIFLTDGLPTVGVTAERRIREAVESGNPHHRRIFTVGVGVDVNTPLLSAVARVSRGAPTIVLPGEDVEVRTASLGRRLSGPVLADCRLALPDGRIHDLLPLPADLFAGERLVALARYSGSGPLTFRLSGRDATGPREFEFTFRMDCASSDNRHVPRLWAAGRIAQLTEAIRDLGEVPAAPGSDPRFSELVGEIVRLSKRFGVLSEYTAFFADDGNLLSAAPGAVERRAESEFRAKALGIRSGAPAASQEWNIDNAKALKLNPRNSLLTADLSVSETGNVRQVSDRAYFRQDGAWVDSRASAPGQADETVEVGSEAFGRLVDRLAASGRLACLSLSGDLLIDLDGRRILVTSRPTPGGAP